MLTLKKIAVTGILSSGKSTVCSFFEECGAYVVSADKIVHHLLSPNTPLGKKIIELLGLDVVQNNQFDHKEIAKKVFNDKDLLLGLENLLHPVVRKNIEREYLVALKQKAPLFVVEEPLLFETGAFDFYDYIIVVKAHIKNCCLRFTTKTNHEKKEFYQRMAHQKDLEEKVSKADVVIDNNDTIENLRAATKNIFNSFTKLGD